MNVYKQWFCKWKKSISQMRMKIFWIFENKPIYIVFYRWINILILVRDFVGFRPFYRLSKTVAERKHTYKFQGDFCVFLPWSNDKKKSISLDNLFGVLVCAFFCTFVHAHVTKCVNNKWMNLHFSTYISWK